MAPVMERFALIGGIDGASCVLGAKLSGEKPQGNISHTVMIISGDTINAARAYNVCLPKKEPRIILIDTFKDDAEESIRVILDQAGFPYVNVFVSGGLTPERISILNKELVDAFGAEVVI